MASHDTPKCAVGDGLVVLNKVELGVALVREEHLVRVGDLHLPATDLNRGFVLLRHELCLLAGDFSIESARPVASAVETCTEAYFSRLRDDSS